MPEEFSAVLVKGRSNYLSLRRLDAAAPRAGATFGRPEEFDQLADIMLWAGRPRTGAGRTSTSARARRSGTRWPASTATAWARSARGSATASTSPPASGCGTANLLVVNHALFMSDLALAGLGRRASCPSTTSPSSTRRTPSKPSPATTSACGSRAARSSSPSTGSTTTGPARGCWSTTTSTRRWRRPSGPRIAGRLLPRPWPLAGAQGGVQRPAPEPVGPARHPRRGASQARHGDRRRRRGDRGGRPADRADRRLRSAATAWRKPVALAGAGHGRLGLLDRPGAGGPAPRDPGVRPARHRADPPPRPLRAGPDVHPDLGHPERRLAPRLHLRQEPDRPDQVRVAPARQPVRLPEPGGDPHPPEPARPVGRPPRVRARGDPGDPVLPGEDARQGVRPVHLVPR